ncbi:unnamed protein product [Rhizoctonia solani]|uniref:Uncharacterized protein n=1 Tax=Rhizoctonia solani TaxID=456999 RepID=A0A8H3BUD0_9AGAM|nr:unnamed protein product [Rhizoctonia solani]
MGGGGGGGTLAPSSTKPSSQEKSEVKFKDKAEQLADEAHLLMKRQLEATIKDDMAEWLDDFFFGDDAQPPQLRKTMITVAQRNGISIDLAEGIVDIAFEILKDIMSNTQTGGRQKPSYLLFIRHKTIIRVDLRAWRYVPRSKDSSFAAAYYMAITTLTKDASYIPELTKIIQKRVVVDKHTSDDYFGDLLEKISSGRGAGQVPPAGAAPESNVTTQDGPPCR